MTNPNDPWVRPEGQPPGQFGPGGPAQPTEQFPQGGPAQPTEQFAPGQPMPPTEQFGPGQQLPYGQYPVDQQPPHMYAGPPPGQPPYGQPAQYGEVPPLGPGGPGNKPPRSTGLLVGIGAVAGALVVGVIAGAFLLLGKNNDDKDSANASAETSLSSEPDSPDSSDKSGPDSTGAPSTSRGSDSFPGLDPDSGSNSRPLSSGLVVGQVRENNGSTLTVDSRLNGRITVHVTSKTRVVSVSGPNVSDLAVGDTVVVKGTKDSDDTITASLIIGNPKKR